MKEDTPTEDQMKAAEAQFDKLSPTKLVRIGKRIGMTMTAGGMRHGAVELARTMKVIKALKKMSKKAKKAEAHGEYEKAKEIGLQMLKMIEEQNKKQLSLDAMEMLTTAEDDIKKSIANVDKKINGE